MTKRLKNSHHVVFTKNVTKTCESKYHKGPRTTVKKGMWYVFPNEQLWCPECIKNIVDYNVREMRKNAKQKI